MRSRTLACGLLLLSLLAFPTITATTLKPAWTFIGQWNTELERIDYPECVGCTGHWARVGLTVTEDTDGNQTVLDGEWTQEPLFPATNSEKGFMHGTVSSDGKVWKGVWWAATPYAHGGFELTLTGPYRFKGTFTQSKHANDKAIYQWISPPVHPLPK